VSGECLLITETGWAAEENSPANC